MKQKAIENAIKIHNSMGVSDDYPGEETLKCCGRNSEMKQGNKHRTLISLQSKSTHHGGSNTAGSNTTATSNTDPESITP
jgi:hypothetical protein